MFVSPMIAACSKEPEAALMLRGISKQYAAQTVVKDVYLSVGYGEIFGLLGPNGAGKTTLMKLLCGLSRPSAGQLLVFGRAAEQNKRWLRQAIALVPQEINLEREFTVEEALDSYARLYDVAERNRRISQVLAEFDLSAVKKKRIGELSGGTQRRALLARALLPEPQLLLLDEPTVGLDPDIRWELWSIIRQLADKGKTIFLTTHYMEEAEQLCHRVALIKAGTIIAVDTPAGIKHLACQEADEALSLEKAFIRLIREDRSE